MADQYSDTESFIGTDDERSDSLAAQRKKDQSFIVGKGVPSYPAFEVLTLWQKVSVVNYLRQRFGLGEDDAVVNLFGLPFMPIPQPRRTSSGSQYRALPKTLSRSPICVHPIYWVDEEVYGEIPTDTSSFEAQRWSTRMFAFLLLCGYYDSNYTFRDYLSKPGREMFLDNGKLDPDMSGDLMTYLEALGAASVFDGTEYLSFESINVDFKEKGFDSKREYFEYFAKRVQDKCDAAVNETADNAYSELSDTLTASDRYLFSKNGDGKICFDPDEPESFWDENIADHFFHVENNYEDVLESNAPVQLLESAVRSCDNAVEDAILAMNRAVSVLVGPVLSSNPDLSDEDAAALTAYNTLATDTDEYAETPYEYSVAEIVSGARPSLERMIDEERRDGKPLHEESIKKAKDFLEERRTRYNDAWMRLFLVRYNYDRSIDGDPLETSFHGAVYKLRTSR